MDVEELAAFTDAVRKVAQRDGTDFDSGLEAVGWREALVDDPAAARAVFTVQGELNLSSSALDDVLLNALGRTPTPDTAVLISPSRISTRRLTTASDVLVIYGHLAVTVPRRSLTIRSVRGMDPDGGWTEAASRPDITLLGGGELVPTHAALTAGRLALATELAAASRAMLDLARDHAMSRVQFGRPIASFQAVRHRLADSLIALASAEASIDVGWEDPTPYTTTMAKAIAGRSARTVARHAQQVLAGMGFTSEHPFHRYLRRVLVLDQILGSTKQLSTAMGQEAIRRRTIPSMLEL
ncbi:MAG: acyl-CoA dehydrogenase family protein [Mycobacteriales bacterium]